MYEVADEDEEDDGDTVYLTNNVQVSGRQTDLYLVDQVPSLTLRGVIRSRSYNLCY